MNLDFSDLYYIYNFKFSDGSTKNKYLLVLSDSDSENKIILSLPTSIGRVPDHLEKGQSGCINCDKSHFNCYRILKDVIVTKKSGYTFPRDTYIYGEWIQNWNTTTLKLDYSVEGIDFEYLGKVKTNHLKDILECFVSSIKVKRKYKKIFLSILEKLS